jgi:hypothetical protein
MPSDMTCRRLALVQGERRFTRLFAPRWRLRDGLRTDLGAWGQNVPGRGTEGSWLSASIQAKDASKTSDAGEE